MNNKIDKDLLQFPKVELHRHLEGAIRLSTLGELAKITDQHALREQFLVETPMVDLATVLKKFYRIQSLLSSEEILTRIAVEAIEDAHREGIRILELRYDIDFIMNGHKNLTRAKIIEAITKAKKMTVHLPIAVGFIAIFIRTNTIATSQELCDIILDHRKYFVGADLANDEAGSSTLQFKPIFKRVFEAGVPITIHAGEVPSTASAKNVMTAINELSAVRIGHGIMSINDPETLQLVVKKKIPLEVSVTSNWLTQAVPSIADHPIRKLRENGVLVTINSDDPGAFGIDLPHEYQVLRNHFQFSDADFTECNDIAARASFIPLAEKQKHWPRPI